jgi:hypothetical protein
MEIQLQLTERLKPVLGSFCTKISRSSGSILNLTLSKTLLQNETEQWALKVLYCAWRLETPTTIVTASEDRHSHMDQHIKILEGVQLGAIRVVKPSLETIITFTNKIVLHLFPIYTQNYEHWQLLYPDKNILVVGPNSHWTYHQADEIRPHYFDNK